MSVTRSMHCPVGRSRRWQATAGYALLEALIAVIVTSIGFIGAARLQTVGTTYPAAAQAAVAESPAEATFAAAVAAFTAGREAQRRRDLLFEDVPAPKRLAPFAIATAATVSPGRSRLASPARCSACTTRPVRPSVCSMR